MSSSYFVTSSNFTKEQIESAAKVKARATGDWSFYEYPYSDHDRKRHREEALAILEAAKALEDAPDPQPHIMEKYIEAVAEASYNENTGTRGKFHTSYYKDAWIRLMRRAVEGVDNAASE